MASVIVQSTGIRKCLRCRGAVLAHAPTLGKWMGLWIRRKFSYHWTILGDEVGRLSGGFTVVYEVRTICKARTRVELDIKD